MQTPMWKDTICEFMCSWSWHQVPSCWQQWYHANLWRTTSRVLKGTNLPAQLGCPCHGNPHKSCGWRGCPCEPSATGSPPNQDYWRVKKTPKRMGLGCFRPPRPQRVPWVRSEAGHGAAVQMGTPVCTQQPGSGQNCSDQAKNTTHRLKPFKECYRCIPPHMYNNMRAHIQEMLDIGAIHKSHSLLASTVILAQKKDSSLRFCIGLRKLNNRTVKDAYSLP